MKKTLLIFMIGFCFNCSAQRPVLEDLSSKSDLNYTLALIRTGKTIRKELYNGGLIVTIYQISDPKATPVSFSQDGEGFLDSYIISSISDDEYYATSKLYKIKGVYNPKILEIKEMVYPKFLIKIEYGAFKKRQIKVFEFEGM